MEMINTKITIKHLGNGYYSNIWRACVKVTNGEYYKRLYVFAITSSMENSEHSQKALIRDYIYETFNAEKYFNDDDYANLLLNKVKNENNELINVWERASQSIFGLLNDRIADIEL